MDIHNELKAMMDINLKPEFELAINEVIEKSYKADIEKLGPGMAGLVKCQWEKMKPYLFFAYCLGAKAQAVPEGFVLVEKKEFEQMQEFEDLYRRAIFNSKKSIHEANWSHVSNLGVGSTRAKAMCKRFNIDPEATFRKPQGPTND